MLPQKYEHWQEAQEEEFDHIRIILSCLRIFYDTIQKGRL